MKFCVGVFFLYALHLMADCSLNNSALSVKEGEIIDKKSGLIWRQCSLGQEWKKGKGCVGNIELMKLQEAKLYAQKLGNGWRLPSIDELLTLVEKRCHSPVLNAKFFGKVYNTTGEGAIYWSASVYLEGDEVIPSLFYTLDFMNGGVDAHTKSFFGAIRLVR